jgi:hypothetical protein
MSKPFKHILHESTITDKDCPYSMCVTYMSHLHSWITGVDERITNIEKWLKENIGDSNFIFVFEDYGQHGEYMLYTRSEEDLLAFKIKWDLGPLKK